ncbi:valine--pyruvate transaminase [Luteolibacter algae]|uniref:Valine--pyruvate transaminase n=1 Tax=Luteolibacter algae TaxID=454151 RepID=A0ABW5DAD5_9BACT
MTYHFSNIGQALAGGSGIGELMDDLGQALANGGPDLKMLGGGQPAQITEINEIWRNRLAEISCNSVDSTRLLSIYDPPQGNPRFISAITNLLKDSFGWNLGEENIALTSGGQTAFFYLFNLLAGTMPDGQKKKILFPLVPEYIGYAAQGLDPEMFHALKPEIEEIGQHQFKYHIDFDRMKLGDDIAAICVSRPTNPTGNVLTDDEIKRLSDLAEENKIPLIIDNAYGAPFPGIIFTDVKPIWDEHIILTLSLSKLGLPGTRTGIVIGSPEIIRAVSSMTAIIGLSNPNTGPQVVLPIIENGEILSLSQNVIRPYYENKSKIAQQAARDIFQENFPWRMHLSEGALFLWLWFPGLSITSNELYKRLKAREVLVIPGHHFFFGCDEENWQHRHECIRVSFAMDERIVRDGLQIIAEEVIATLR